MRQIKPGLLPVALSIGLAVIGLLAWFAAIAASASPRISALAVVLGGVFLAAAVAIQAIKDAKDKPGTAGPA